MNSILNIKLYHPNINNLKSRNFDKNQGSVSFKSAQKTKELEFLSNKQKWAILGASTAGMVGGLALCSRRQNINIFNWNEFKKLKIESLEILALAAGSLLGGLTGGLLVDKTNKKDKLRESLQQFVGNIIFPVSFVAVGNWMYDKIVKKTGFKMPEVDSKVLNAVLKSLPPVVVVLGSLAAGVLIGNEVANSMNNKIFVEDEDRDIKITDLAAHVDDTLLGASLVAQNLSPSGGSLASGSAVASVASRLIPPALVIPGYMAGIAQ